VLSCGRASKNYELGIDNYEFKKKEKGKQNREKEQ